MIQSIYKYQESNEPNQTSCPLTLIEGKYEDETVMAIQAEPERVDTATYQSVRVEFIPSLADIFARDSEYTALISEEAISKIWDTPEEDEAWRDL